MKSITLSVGLLLLFSINVYSSARVFNCLNLGEEIAVFDFNYVDTSEKEYDLGMGKNLEVDLEYGGSITITGWDKEKLNVRLLSKGSYNNYELNVENIADGIKVTTDILKSKHNHGNIELEIKAPKKCNLELNTSGGEISIDSIEGEINGETKGGRLSLNNLKGKLHCSTMGGRIDLTSSNVDGEVSTMGGEINIEDVVGDIKGKSMGGSVSYKNVTNRKGESTGSAIILSTMGGGLNVDNAPGGTDLNTMGGEIKVGKAQKYVKAKTMGGNIKIKEVDGWVEATTMGGEISVNLLDELKNEKHNVKLKSMGGDITLYVPDNFSMDVDITLAYTKNNEDEVDIISDFNINKERTKEWDTSKGSKKKYIYGTAKLNGAKNKVIIETVNGNVYLKKN
jgi:hypothetical protein